MKGLEPMVAAIRLSNLTSYFLHLEARALQQDAWLLFLKGSDLAFQLGRALLF